METKETFKSLAIEFAEKELEENEKIYQYLEKVSDLIFKMTDTEVTCVWTKQYDWFDVMANIYFNEWTKEQKDFYVIVEYIEYFATDNHKEELVEIAQRIINNILYLKKLK